MNQADYLKKIFVGITGQTRKEWVSKLEEIESYDIKEAALFIECYERKERDYIYKALLESKIEKLLLVHIRDDVEKDELIFLEKNFESKYFTIHEDHFKHLGKWQGYHDKLYLEMNTDDYLSQTVDVSKIAGFCIDLSHFKVEQVKKSKEFDYVKKRQNKDIFNCNHVNGYCYKENRDLHTVKSLNDFKYLEELPSFLVGDFIAIETYNRIKEQLEFKENIAYRLSRMGKEFL